MDKKIPISVKTKSRSLDYQVAISTQQSPTFISKKKKKAFQSDL